MSQCYTLFSSFFLSAHILITTAGCVSKHSRTFDRVSGWCNEVHLFCSLWERWDAKCLQMILVLWSARIGTEISVCTLQHKPVSSCPDNILLDPMWHLCQYLRRKLVCGHKGRVGLYVSTNPYWRCGLHWTLETAAVCNDARGDDKVLALLI